MYKKTILYCEYPKNVCILPKTYYERRVFHSHSESYLWKSIHVVSSVYHCGGGGELSEHIFKFTPTCSWQKYISVHDSWNGGELCIYVCS
jgi:hypothetical protein